MDGLFDTVRSVRVEEQETESPILTHGLSHPKLDPALRKKIWEQLPEIISPYHADRFASFMYAQVRKHQAPGSSNAIIMGDTHGVTGELAVALALIRRARSEGIHRYLMECPPSLGKAVLKSMPVLTKKIADAGGLDKYIKNLPEKDLWGALPTIAMSEAIKSGLKVGFIDSESEDNVVRNRTMANGIRYYAERGENVLALIGCVHVPDVHREIALDIPGRRKINSVSGQVVAPISESVRNFVEYKLRNKTPPGRGFIFRLGEQMMSYIPKGVDQARNSSLSEDKAYWVVSKEKPTSAKSTSVLRTSNPKRAIRVLAR